MQFETSPRRQTHFARHGACRTIELPQLARDDDDAAAEIERLRRTLPLESIGARARAILHDASSSNTSAVRRPLGTAVFESAREFRPSDGGVSAGSARLGDHRTAGRARWLARGVRRRRAKPRDGGEQPGRDAHRGHAIRGGRAVPTPCPSHADENFGDTSLRWPKPDGISRYCSSARDVWSQRSRRRGERSTDAPRLGGHPSPGLSPAQPHEHWGSRPYPTTLRRSRPPSSRHRCSRRWSCLNSVWTLPPPSFPQPPPTCRSIRLPQSRRRRPYPSRFRPGPTRARLTRGCLTSARWTNAQRPPLLH
jgi:hypothetical protein